MKVQFYIVQSCGGAKGDFLAGWLGSLPQFLDSSWTIDWETGQSFTMAKFFKDFGQDNSPIKNVRNFLHQNRYTLHQEHDFLLAGTTHDPHIARYVSADHRSLVRILSIKVSHERLAEVAWNFFVKTFLTKHRYTCAFENGITYGVDHYLQAQGISVCNDRVRLDCIDRYLQNIDLAEFSYHANQYDYLFDYDKLFSPDGSRHLVRGLGLCCSEQHHQQWNQNLIYSCSPDQITRFGRTFYFADFKQRLLGKTG